MSAALASLIALLVAIVLSIVSRINIGLVAIGLAWLIGVYLAGMKPEAIAKGFPAPLFLTLAGVTLLFAAAETNGTLERIAHRAVDLARGRAALLPILFFVIACTVSTVGPGAISSVALIAPLAMVIGHRAGVPAFLSALMVANGANAGNLSPLSTVGIIANAKMAEAGLGGHEGKVWFANLVAHIFVSIAGYLLFGGLKLRGAARFTIEKSPFTVQQRLTLAVLFAWIAGVLLLKLNVGMSAVVAALILIVGGAADETTSIKRMPWAVIIMVCGVSVLIGLLEATGGMELFTTLLAKLATPKTINGTIALATGAISTYSSTSGVVLPAFLPAVPSFGAKVGGGDPLAVALSINVGASVVDVSPLSTLGALCLAALPAGEDSPRLFRQLLMWGLSMVVVGAVICQLLAGVLSRA